MSNRIVSDELANAVIAMVQECQSISGEPWTNERTEGAKIAIADVLDLLEAVVAKEVAKALNDARRGSADA